MKALLPLLFLLAAISSAPADEIPVAIGQTKDAVFHRTGQKPVGKAVGMLLPEYQASVTYADNRTVTSVLLSTRFKVPVSPSTLHGIALGQPRKDVLKKLGPPTKQVPPAAMIDKNVYVLIWRLPNHTDLDVAFWTGDDGHHPKDTVSSVNWYNPNPAPFVN